MGWWHSPILYSSTGVRIYQRYHVCNVESTTKQIQLSVVAPDYKLAQMSVSPRH